MNSSEVLAQCLQNGEHLLQTSDRPCEIATGQGGIQLTDIPTIPKVIGMPFDAPLQQCDQDGPSRFCHDCGLCTVIQSL